MTSEAIKEGLVEEIPAEESLSSDDIREIRGTRANIDRHGSPIESRSSAPLRYYFYPTWRSQLIPLIGFFVLSLLAIKSSELLRISVIDGKLFAIGDTTYFLSLPLFSLLPAFLLGKILIYIYDAKYIIDEGGVEAQIGLVSLSLRQPRLRYEDIRGVEPNQTIVERLLGIGSVLIGSAMTNDVEIVMEGVGDPRAIQLLINGERERRTKLMTRVSREGIMPIMTE